MAKKRTGNPEEQKQAKSVSRRNFLTQGAVAGVSAAALGASVGETSAQGTAADGIKWDYEADLVVIGSGASGLPCAIRARDAGLRVLIVDQNFDVGGKMAAQRRTGLARRRRPVPAARHRRRRRQGRLHQGSPAAQAGGNDRRRRLPVQGHDRLVGARRRGAGALPLQRPRRASGLGRQLLRHPAIPDGQLCPLCAHHRHALQRRHVARPAGDSPSS